jgi:NAD(P)-dependent dehydrogenase (short-subunit alcohol dehydrogenase family)
MGEFLEGKVVVVTGAGRGIGRAVALACAAEGASVVVDDYGVSVDGLAPSSAVAEAVVTEITQGGGKAIAVADSVTTMDGAEHIVRVAVDHFGRLDGVVCVAGILRGHKLFEMPEDDWDAVIAAHLKGTFTLFRAASAIMRQQRFGRLVGFTSGIHVGSVSHPNYSAAKAGIASLVRSAALVLHEYGVTANAVAPVARTRMTMDVPGFNEMPKPDDIAPLVVYLLSDAARDVTGQIYTAAGAKIAVWAQPQEVRAIFASEPWTPQRIAEVLPTTLGQESMPMLGVMEEIARAVAAGESPPWVP